MENTVHAVLTKTKHGRHVDTYDVCVEIDDVKVDAGSLHLARSLVEKRHIIIEIGPANMKIGDKAGGQNAEIKG